MDYRAIDAINQSRLKKILIHPKMYFNYGKEQTEDEKNHFVLGTMIDKMIEYDYTEKGNIEDEYYFMNASPSDKVKMIVDIVFATLSEVGLNGKLNNYKDLIVDACNEVGYYKVANTQYNKIVEFGSEYYNCLKEAGDRVVTSYENYEKALFAVEAVRNEDSIYNLLYQEGRIDKEVIVFKLQGKMCKCELDMIIIDEENKTIQPIDIKHTSKSLNSFESNIWKLRYDFQAAFYMKALESKYSPEYKILPFKIVAVEVYNEKPEIFEFSHEVIEAGYSGGLVRGRYIEGVKQAFSRLRFHEHHSKWDYKMEYYRNGYKNIVRI